MIASDLPPHFSHFDFPSSTIILNVTETLSQTSFDYYTVQQILVSPPRLKSFFSPIGIMNTSFWRLKDKAGKKWR